jgi:exodeoxyribonuclease-3
MKVCTWNVNGIRARESQVREWIERERPDIVCLQEIKAKPEQVPALLFDAAGYWCYWHGAGSYSGVALHVRREVARERPICRHPNLRDTQP